MLICFRALRGCEKESRTLLSLFLTPSYPSLPENVRIPESIQISIIFERGNGRLLLEGRKA